MLLRVLSAIFAACGGIEPPVTIQAYTVLVEDSWSALFPIPAILGMSTPIVTGILGETFLVVFVPVGVLPCRLGFRLSHLTYLPSNV